MKRKEIQIWGFLLTFRLIILISCSYLESLPFCSPPSSSSPCSNSGKSLFLLFSSPAAAESDESRPSVSGTTGWGGRLGRSDGRGPTGPPALSSSWAGRSCTRQERLERGSERGTGERAERGSRACRFLILMPLVYFGCRNKYTRRKGKVRFSLDRTRERPSRDRPTSSDSTKLRSFSRSGIRVGGGGGDEGRWAL